MNDLWQRLQQRKIVQWALGAWVLLQALDLAEDSCVWPTLVMRLAFGLIALGFLVTLVPFWDPVREGPHFRELLRQLNLNEFCPADADSTPGFC